MGFSGSGRRAAAVLSLLSFFLVAGCAMPAGSGVGSGGTSGDLSGASSSQSSPAQSAPADSSSQTDGVPDEIFGGTEQGHTDSGSVKKAGNQGGTEAGTDMDVPVSEVPAQPYDFSKPAPESPAVDNSYFEDAAFIGDSRTDGFLIYSGIGCGDNLTSNGLSIFKLAEKKALTIDGEKYTLLEALALKEYGKVYLSLGVNELGYYDDEGFYQSYLDAIDAIRAVQPNAVIYIQGLIPLNEEQIAATSGRTYLTNDHLRVYNDLMFQAAQEKQVVFLDLYSVFADENGSLPAEASKDGVHLKSDYCKKWLTYLQTHTVSYDSLYPSGAPSARTAGAQGELSAEGSENP